MKTRLKSSVFFFAAFLFFIQGANAQLTFWNYLNLYYPLNTDSVIDFSGNGYNASASHTSFATGVFGDENGCYYFNGNNSKLVRPALLLGDSVTMSCWIYSEADSQAAPLLYNGHTANAGFGVFVKKPFGNFGNGYLGKTLVLHQGGVSESYFNNQFELPTNQWLHLAVVRRGQVIELYLNGIFQTSAPYVANPTEGEFSVGASTDHVTVGYPAFKGKIDEVMVFSSALSSENVYKVFQANLTSTGSLGATKQGLRLIRNTPSSIEILTEDHLPIHQIRVFDAMGKILVDQSFEKAASSQTFDLQNFPAGILTIQAMTPSGIRFRRIAHQ